MKRIITTILLLIFAVGAGAQTEPLLTQYYNSPALINPSYAGVFSGKIRGIINYKRQWENISDPFQTIAASVDFQLARDVSRDDLFGMSVDFMQDKAGASNYSSLGANLSFSYAKALDSYAHHFLAFGFQAGYGQKSAALTALRWGNQWTDTGFDPTGSSGENFVDEAVQYIDLSGGVSYHFTNEANSKFVFGFAAYHLNQPKISFLGSDARLKQKFIIHSRFTYEIADKGIAINPSAIYMWQGTAWVLRYGLDVEFLFNKGSRHTGFVKHTSLSIGVYHTWKEMISPMVKLEKAGFALYLSYDFNFGNITRVNNGFGGPEFALVYRFGHNDGRSRRNVTNAFF